MPYNRRNRKKSRRTRKRTGGVGRISAALGNTWNATKKQISHRRDQVVNTGHNIARKIKNTGRRAIAAAKRTKEKAINATTNKIDEMNYNIDPHPTLSEITHHDISTARHEINHALGPPVNGLSSQSSNGFVATGGRRKVRRTLSLRKRRSPRNCQKLKYRASPKTRRTRRVKKRKKRRRRHRRKTRRRKTRRRKTKR
jgi:cell fate (sporulation/competence/biofilm development) regulator YmcA (YheA/YmcA/DUF963 family)